MNVKIVNTAANTVQYRECQHVNITEKEDGIDICCLPSGDLFNLPADGNEAYFINAAGVTEDARYWPRRQRRYARGHDRAVEAAAAGESIKRETS